MLDSFTRARTLLFATLSLSLSLAAVAGCGDDIRVRGPVTDPDPDPDPDPTTLCSAPGSFADARAHFVNGDTILFPGGTAGTRFELGFAESGLCVEGGDLLDAAGALSLTENTAVAPAIASAFPHLADYRSFTVDDTSELADIVKGQILMIEKDGDGDVLSATRVQIAGVLDALFHYTGPLGVTFAGDNTPTFNLWAPTARGVTLTVYDASTKNELDSVDMSETKGVWSVTGKPEWHGHYYKYAVDVFVPALGEYRTNLVTDPYSVGLSTNSQHSLIVNLDDASTKPAGWDSLAKPALDRFEDISLYELHIRDFSVSDATVPAEHRGKFMAFTHDGSGSTTESNGMAHIKGLAAAGLSHVHLLPAFDIATVEEDEDKRVELDSMFDKLCAANSSVPADDCSAYTGMTIRQVFESLDPTAGDKDNPDTAAIQRIATYFYELDGFNWGYDPYHYTAPEGSYATDPEGVTRIREFRAMIQSLNQNGLRVVMDVVYNHTHAAGQDDKAVLDRIVPGYYHRLNQATGGVETSTCCQNTATEHTMMGRLMTDSVVTWARDFKVDGFRFDLMGHHMKADMQEVQIALNGLTMADDGVDGSKVYVYGEGWNFGEVGDNKRGENGTQLNMPGTGIGTFSDRLRDGVRGGGPFDDGETLRDRQGFATGMCYEPNRALSSEDLDAQCKELLGWSDMIRVGMAGNLADMVIVSGNDVPFAGEDVSYYGGKAGYTLDPQEVITYIAAHDNQTLWDNNQYKLHPDTSLADRVRVQNIGNSVVVLAQGVPFLHAGQEMLRSKSFTRDSYNSGDWFNVLDYTYQSNNWNVGLPRHDKDGNSWPIISTVLGNPNVVATQSEIQAAVAHVEEMLSIRASSPLFRLATGAEVTTRVDYHNTGKNQIPGLIVQSITDGTCAGADLDPAHDAILVFVNANDEAQDVVLAGLDGFVLHPVQVSSSDTVVRTAAFNDGSDTFSIPARTAAVFVKPQGGAQGAGIACNDRERFEVYLRGTVTDWNTIEEGFKFTKDGDTAYSVTVALEATSYVFKVGSDDWEPYSFGLSGGSVTPDGTPLVLVNNGSDDDVSIDITEAGNYKFTFDLADFANPTIKVERVLPGLQVYLRGTVTSWDSPPPASALFQQDPGNERIYTVRATIAASATPYEFKVADAGYSDYNWGIDGGSVTPDDGVSHIMTSGQGNVGLTVATSGTFLFTLDVTNADAPTIKVERQVLSSDIFVKGEMNNWGNDDGGAPESGRLIQDANDTDVFRVTIALEAQAYKFKVADSTWSEYNWGNGAANITPGDAPLAMIDGGDMTVTIATGGNYVFTVNTSNLAIPTLQIAAE